MGCCASVGVPIWSQASESEVWRHLVLISSEASYRLSLGLEASDVQIHGVQAWDAIKTLHTRYAWSWARIEAELRRRDLFIWLYRRTLNQGEQVEVEDWGEEVTEGNGEVAVLIGTQLEAVTMRSLMRERGVGQTW